PEGGVITIETSNYYLDRSFIKIHKYGHVGEYVRISISDTGYGIPKDIQDKIFDPFFTTKEQGKGTGLGLSIVYNIIKQHNGYINVYSEEGIGTTFNIYLPISQEEEVNNFNSEKDSSFVSKLNINILVVDDDEMVLHSLKNYLETLGAQVFTARSGKEALDFFEKNYNNTDLLILDIILPDINGLILYKKIREIKEDIKIIFISGYNISVIKEIEDIDFDVPFIQKPLSMTKLVELINKITSQ
ncbi:MAG: ATP-binding protein, partial [Proteobacteria bacterium]|nr:ATP-binding protein [Pseudomonadota bacterium]